MSDQTIPTTRWITVKGEDYIVVTDGHSVWEIKGYRWVRGGRQEYSMWRPGRRKTSRVLDVFDAI